MKRLFGRNFWKLWISSPCVISLIKCLSFSFFSLFLALAPDLLVRLEVLALLGGELDARLPREQLAESLSAGCRVGLFP